MDANGSAGLSPARTARAAAVGSKEPWSVAPHGRKAGVLAAVAGGTFMSALNSSMVNAVLPVLVRDLRVDLATAEWVTMVFLVVVAGSMLAFGRLGDLFGHKRVYLAGTALFVAAAVGCALAGGAAGLIGARAAQALGAAMVLSNAPAILVGTFGAHERGRALGIQATLTYLGMMLGPWVGGALAERFGWPAAFLVSVPAGLVTAVLAAFAVEPERVARGRERFDLAGATAFLAGFAALLLAMSHGQSWGWTSPAVVGLLTGSAAALGGFVVRDRRAPAPMLDLVLLRERVVFAAAGSALLSYVCLNAAMFLMPFYLQHFRAIEPSQAGVLLAAQALAMALVAPVSGAVSDRVGPRIPATLGMAAVTAGIALLATLDQTATRAAIAGRLALLGVGSGLFAPANNSAMYGAVPRQRQGVAAAVLGSARYVGMVLGVALAGAVFARALGHRGGELGSGVGFLGAFRATLLVVASFGVAATVLSFSRGGSRAATGPPQAGAPCSGGESGRCAATPHPTPGHAAGAHRG